MGHDEQKEVFPIVHVKFVFGQMRPVPVDGDQNPIAGTIQE